MKGVGNRQNKSNVHRIGVPKGQGIPPQVHTGREFGRGKPAPPTFGVQYPFLRKKDQAKGAEQK
ncbi:MAG: hypothetical protein RDV41_05300 [Planctomycetota bacterium]|nr:hypothetical protein [Planctomycetota bacterium]